VGPYDAVYSGTARPATVVHSVDLLAKLLRLLRPSGRLVLAEPVVPTEAAGARTAEALVRDVKLAGFTKAAVGAQQAALPAEVSSVAGATVLVQVTAEKPAYEVGAAVPLALRRKTAQTGTLLVSAAAGVRGLRGLTARASPVQVDVSRVHQRRRRRLCGPRRQARTTT